MYGGEDKYASQTNKLLRNLLEETTENIRETTKQNKRLGRYTLGMFIMTVVITICTVLQVIIASKVWPFEM